MFAAQFGQQLHAADSIESKCFDVAAFRLHMAQTISGKEVPPERYEENDGIFAILQN